MATCTSVTEFSLMLSHISRGATMLKDLLSNWPLLQQIRTGADGTGPEAMSEKTRKLKPKFEGAEVARSICPYCGVGCGQLAFHKNGKLISIEENYLIKKLFTAGLGMVCLSNQARI